MKFLIIACLFACLMVGCFPHTPDELMERSSLRKMFRAESSYQDVYKRIVTMAWNCQGWRFSGQIYSENKDADLNLIISDAILFFAHIEQQGSSTYVDAYAHSSSWVKFMDSLEPWANGSTECFD